MERIAKVHYIVHPLWFLDHNRDETISLVDKLIDLGRVNGQNRDTMFVMDMNNSSMYFDSVPKEWSAEKLEVEEKVVERLHRQYALKLEKALSESCRNFHPEVPYHWPEFIRKGKRRYGEVQLSPGFQSFLNDRDLRLIDGVKMFGHGAIRDACVEAGLEYFAEAVKKKSGFDCSYEVCLETTMI